MEAEVGLGGEWLSETLGPWGDTVSVGRTRPCPGCAHLPARLAQGKGTVWLCVESVRAGGWPRRLQAHPTTLAQASMWPAGSQEAK